jgi:hypothetical protein|tara:strand:+ start:376 stop:555 length:180 start_codon:yes stop_codon:yes gene_type:complete
MGLKESYKIMELEERIQDLESKVELIFGNSDSFANGSTNEVGIIDLIKSKKVTKRERKK